MRSRLRAAARRFEAGFWDLPPLRWHHETGGSMDQGKVRLGDRVRDRVTGCEGVVIGITRWLTGCDSATVQPPLDKDGKTPPVEHVDVIRLEVLESGAVKLGAAPEPTATETRPPVANAQVG